MLLSKWLRFEATAAVSNPKSIFKQEVQNVFNLYILSRAS